MTTITVPAGDYYLSTADSEAESLIDTIETLLNAAGLGSTYTVSLDAGEGGSGKVTITSDGAGGVTEVAIVWTDTGLRDVLGYETDGNVSGALSHESSGQARSLWISDAFGQGYNGAGDGWEESDYGAAEHFAGPVFGFRANRKTVNALLFEASARSRTWQDEEVTDGESLQRFWRDVLFCESPASKVAGGPVRWHPDAGDDASYREYRVTDSGSFAPTEHVANQSTSWTATIRRLLLRSSVGSPTPKQGRLEGRITVPTGGYSFELTEVAGIQYMESLADWNTHTSMSVTAGSLWRFDQSSGDATDLGSYGVTLHPENSPTQNIDDADLGICVGFGEGSAERMTSDDNTEHDLGTSESWVLGMVIKMMVDSTSSNNTLGGKRKTTSHFDGYRMGYRPGPGGPLRFQAIFDGDGATLDVENLTHDAGEDERVIVPVIVCDYNADNFQLLVWDNGTVYSTGGQSIATTISTNLEEFCIGAITQTNNAAGFRCGQAWMLRGASCEGFNSTKLGALATGMNLPTS